MPKRHAPNIAAVAAGPPFNKQTIWAFVLDVLDDVQDLVPRTSIRFDMSLEDDLGLNRPARGALANRLNRRFAAYGLRFGAAETAACNTPGEIFRLAVGKARSAGLIS